MRHFFLLSYVSMKQLIRLSKLTKIQRNQKKIKRKSSDRVLSLQNIFDLAMRWGTQINHSRQRPGARNESERVVVSKHATLRAAVHAPPDRFHKISVSHMNGNKTEEHVKTKNKRKPERAPQVMTEIRHDIHTVC